MTTLAQFERRCAICGATSTQTEMVSTTVFGSPDLDFRPPPLVRDSLGAEVQECPGCGYCAGNIAQAPRNARTTVRSARYRRQRRNRRYPSLANRFLCWALVEEGVRRYSQAGHTAVRAAWACDDADARHAARRCRDLTVSLFLKARSRKQQFAQLRGTEDLLLVDLLRRAGHFAEGIRQANTRLRRRITAADAAILRFQLTLLAEKDTSVHQLSLAAAVGDCGMPPDYLRSVWPSWQEPLDAWVADPKPFLTAAAGCTSLSDVWQRLERPDWLLWLYRRSGGSPDHLGLRTFWTWCMTRAVDAVATAGVETTELQNLVTITGRRAAGEASANEWNEAVITFVRRRPTGDRQAHEQCLFDECRALGRTESPNWVAAGEHASRAALQPVAQDSQSHAAEQVNQATQLLKLLANPFLAPARNSRDKRQGAGDRPDLK